MIKIKLRSLGEEKPLEMELIAGENLLQASKRAFSGTPFEENPKELFGAVLNGHFVKKEFWETTVLSEGDNVLFAPDLGGDNQTLRTVAMVAIVVAASAAAPGIGLTAPWAISAFTAGASIVGSLLINSLFPPPTPKGVGDTGEIEDSQMYTITSQSNKTKKLGAVPKVYGEHRMYPLIAANPYTDFEANADGKLIQYLHAVYDFGFGPLRIEDIKIGDTPISEFSDVDLRLVDFNKPEDATEPWDTVLETSFKYYKGDSSTENIGVVLDKNQNDSPTPPESSFRIVRNGAVNSESADSELSVLLVAPQGLVGMSNQGTESERRVFFDIEFAKVGTEDWRPFNDLNYVYDYRASGGDLTYRDVEVGYPYQQLPFLRETAPVLSETLQEDGGTYYWKWGYWRYYGWPKGTTSIILNNDPNLQQGVVIRVSGEVVGTIDEVEPYLGYSLCTLRTPTTREFEVSRTRVWKTENQQLSPPISYVYEEGLIVNRVYRGIPNLTRVAMRGTNTDPIYATYKFWPKEKAQFKVRVTRVQSTSTYTTTIYDSITWSSLTTRFDVIPIRTDKRHVFLELRIRATNQLNGSIQNLSAVATSILDTWDGAQWVKAPSSNPAWVFVDLLTSEVNRRPLDKSKLHMESLIEWAEYCDEIPPNVPEIGQWTYPRFQCNFVLDFDSTLQQVINKVTSAAQASMNIIDGKYGVLIDRKKTIPVQIFTPRNSRNFSSTRSYLRPPHALEVQYIDPNLNWEMGSNRVYADGYTDITATEIEEVTSFGVTNPEQAWRFGRYLMAQAKLRPENISIDVDYEYLVCTRGDYVQYVQDAMLAGGKAARVKSVVGTVVTIDDSLDNFTTNWAYVFRSTSTGEIHSGLATPVSSSEFDLAGNLPEEGDLIVIGESSKVVLDCIVKAIQPKDDFSATLLLVEKADAIHDSETGAGLPAYDPQLSPVSPSDTKPPGPVVDLVVADNAWRCFAGAYEHYVTLDWGSPVGSTYEYFEVFVDSGDGFTLAATTRDSLYEYIVDPAKVGREHKFKVLAVASNGLKLEIGVVPEVSATPAEKITPPSSIAFLHTNVTGEVLELSWDRVIDCDIAYYQIRYSALTNGGSWSASIPLTPVAATSGSTSVQARTGTYFIKAVDFNGNESAQVATAITTIPNLFGLNVIEEVSDTPAFNGQKDRVVKVGSSIVLMKEVEGTLDQQQYYAEGYYYFRELIDLGDIYTVRLQSRIRAEGFTEDDIIGNWDPLAEVVAMSTVNSSDWDVEAQYRVSDKRNVMADWVKLSDIDPLSQGVQANFSEWRKFTMGDVTGRVLQFRLKLISRKRNVTPRVFDGTIVADMPDRDHIFTDMEVTPAGLDLLYDPPFKGPAPSPNIQVTIEGAQVGDRHEITDRTLDGFHIKILDETGTPVTRKVDIVARGYGYKYTEII